jgi:Domain of unknown function (DUF4224)
MRVSARFVFQRARRTCEFCLGRADRIPKTDTRPGPFSCCPGCATRCSSASPVASSGGPTRQSLSAPAQPGNGPTPDALAVSLGARTFAALRALRSNNICRRASPWCRRSTVTIHLVPGRRGLVEQDPIAVGLLNCRCTEVQPRLWPRTFAMRLGEKWTSRANTLVHRVAMDDIALGNFFDVVVGIDQRDYSFHDCVHPLSAPALTCIFVCCHSTPYPGFGLPSPKISPTHLSSLQATLWYAAQRFYSLTLGVRGVSSLPDSKIHSNPATPAMNFPKAHQTDDRFADHGESSLLLSRQEIIALTGTKQPVRQRRWFDSRGWPYVDAMGRSAHPRVARSVFDEKMKRRDPSRAAPQPRFDALDRLARLS